MTEAGWQPPTEFDGFRVKRLLGAGGMGRVYLVHDAGLDRDVAVKFIAAERPEPSTLERFLIEARAVARLQHPNVVAIYRIGEVDGRPYVACELVRGKSLDQAVLPLPWREVMRIGLGLTHGLAAAQARGILHRDIKPANIMLSEHGDVKLVDFGIAKLVDIMPPAAEHGEPGVHPRGIETLPTLTDIPSSTPTPAIDRDRLAMLTRVGTVLGTPRYLAPELVSGARASLRSDVFSLGVVLYELCSGVKRRLEIDEHSGSWIDEPLAPLRSVVPDVAPDFASVIDRCVAMRPDDRYASALDVRDVLERVSSLLARPTTTRIAREGEPPEPGEVIARRYEVVRLLDDGVYEVIDRELDEAVALQLLYGLAPEARTKLRQQVRLARRIAHPNACRVLDLGQRGEQLFVTTELLRGATLRAVMQQESLSFSRKIDLVVQLAAALSAAHQVGIAHGDVRPERVIMESHRVVLAGFGVGRSDAEPAADLHACAVLGAELLAEGAPAIARPALDTVFARALLRQYETVTQFAEAVAFAARGALEAVPAPAPAPVTRDATVEVKARHDVAIAGCFARVATALAFTSSGRDLGKTGEDSGELDSLERIVTELGGTIVSTKPTELIALFGAPRSHGDDVVRATRAAQALVARFHSGAAGLHTGRVKLGAGLVEGEAIDQARELVRGAKTGEVLASAATTRHLLGRFTTDAATGGFRVQPGMLESTGRFDLPPLQGRADELARVERVVHEAFEERSARAVAIIGPAGAGKSRLRLELERRLAELRDAEWLIARANPLGGGVPLGVLQNASAEWFEVAQAAAANGRAAAFTAARRWLEARASVRPVVIALDDLHWADDASREFLAGLRRDLDQVPVAILLFSRAELDAQVDLSITLAPLDAGAARDIAARLAPAAPREAIEEIVRRAGGNPFFLEELAHHAAETGMPRELPASVELAIQARLDQLQHHERRLVLAASVIGREFDRAALEAALVIEPMSAAEIDQALVALERRQIFDLTERYAFHHILIRDVAYAQLDVAAKRRAHLALAELLEKQSAWAHRDPALLLALAQHRDAAGDQRAARAAYRSAGELALSLAAFREAGLALARAEELGEGERDATLIELCGDALLPVDSRAAIARFQSAMDLATTALDRARLFHKLGIATSNIADNPAAIRYFERGLELLGAVDDSTDRAVKLVAARLLAMLGFIHGYEIGDHRLGLSHAERAVALFESVGDLLELAGGLGRLAACYMRAGRWEDRLRANLRTLQIAETLGDLDRQAGAHINLGVNYQVLGRLDTALEHTRRGLELCIRCGRATSRALAHNNLGAILCDAGDNTRARTETVEAIAQAARVGYTRFLQESLSTLAVLDLRAGDLVEAEANARRAIEHARESASPINEGIGVRILAGVLARAGGRDAEVKELLAIAHARLEDDEYERARTWALESKLASDQALREQARDVFARLGAQLDLDKLADADDVR
ncbi:MAG: protein kinase [Myxococcota bacterium]|nr:protein kinase [Myxococcota bacterium]